MFTKYTAPQKFFIRSCSNDPNLKKIADGVKNISNNYAAVAKSRKFLNYAWKHPFGTYFRIGSVFLGIVFFIIALAS